MKEFVHLHVHTEYSLLDGAAKIPLLVKEAKNQGARAVAMTDHGNMYGAIKFYKECKRNNIKPIIGCEFYVTNDLYDKNASKLDENGFETNPKYHLVLLAKNITGFNNLMKLNSKGFVDGFYGKPRIDSKFLSEHCEGLICLSGCIAGEIPQILLNRNLKDPYATAKEYAIKLKNMFAENDFYIEIQNHNIEEELFVRPSLIKLANEIGAKIVATNDIHYIKKSDYRMHDILLCIQTASYYDEPNRFKFPCNEFYMKNYDEMLEAIGLQEALDNTIEIADKCDLEIKFHNYTIPVYIPPDGTDDKTYLRKLCFDGLKKRYKEITPEIEGRANYELEVVISMGFASYYLIVWDFINYSKQHDIPVGAGRGSGVGSIVAYATGITDVDPLEYGLIFERFLNKDRASMPDFDIDFCGDRREEVIDYVTKKYGRENVCQIITFGKMKMKQAIKDVARVFKLPFAEVNKLLKNINVNDKKIKISNLIDVNHECKVKELIEMYEGSDIYREVIDLAIQVEDMPRNRGKHAAGVIICSVPLIEKIPLSRNGDDITTQFDMVECEELGLLKMDFLALKTLTDIKMTKDYVKKYKNIDIDFHKLGYEDEKVYELISSGETETVFQLESSGMKTFMKQLKPSLLEEIIAGVSLYRPGPLDYIPKYVYNKMHQSEIDYRHPLLEPILKSTYGIIVYQEQAMKITQALAGYTMNEADIFRKFISKKKVEDIPKHKKKFTEGCKANNISVEFAETLWGELETFGKYAFNKSHAAAYSVLSYQTAFMKKYYPVEYFCSVINNRMGNPTDTSKYLKLLKNLNIELLPPNINYSFALFEPQDDKIRYGLACIKNVGKMAIEKVIDEREEYGKYADFSDFARRTATFGLNRRMIESLIKGGAFDCFGHNRKTFMSCYEEIIEMEASNNELLNGGQMFFDFMVQDEYKYKELPESNKEKLALEKEVVGRYISGHPLAGHEKDFEEFDFNLSMLNPVENEDVDIDSEETEKQTTFEVKNGQRVYLGGIISDIKIKFSPKSGRNWGYANFEDLSDSAEIMFFNSTIDKYKSLLIDDTMIKIKGRIMLEEDSYPKIEVREVFSWSLNDIEVIKKPIVIDKRIVCIKIEKNDEETLNKVEDILKSQKGENRVRVQIDGNLFEMDYTTGNIEEIKDKIISIVGYRNFKIIENKE